VTARRTQFGRLATTQRLVLRGLLALGALAGLSAGIGALSGAIPDVPGAPYTGTASISALEPIRQRLDSRRGDAELGLLEEDRTAGILDVSTRFKVPVPLATIIFDAALSEGLDPELAFRLVRVESNFNPRARSVADAFGLAQVQLATARHYEPRITEAQLYEPRRNLRIGFRYLYDLSTRYGDDMRLALLAYNVGPARLDEILEDGRTLTGRYAASVMGGYFFRAKTD
jgi:hypothetical protein